MKKTFNFYCDESTHLENDGMPFMLIGYIGSPYNQYRHHKEAIRRLKKEYNFKGEIKWSNVSNAQYPFYNNLVEYFFETDLFFRVIVVDKSKINNDTPGMSYDDFYFKMYYQLLHHKLSMEDTYNIYIDMKDNRSHSKIEKLKKILAHNSSIRTLQAMHSFESNLMQLADLLLGAVNYKLRGMNQVIAKNNLIKKIEQNCVGSLDNRTPIGENKFNRFFIDLQ
jgi:hypothetical protein